MVEKAIEDQELELVHVEVVGSSKNSTVRIYIESEIGITHEDCSLVSRRVEDLLDENDPIESAYTLEVSSPGIERGLYSLKDFEKFADNSAKVKTDTAINGQRNFRGKIIGVKDELVVFDDKTNGVLEIPHSFVKKANLQFDIERELKQAKRR